MILCITYAQVIQRSGQSSPSREVQDILCDNEAIGGLGTEVIITEEDDYEDEDDQVLNSCLKIWTDMYVLFICYPIRTHYH